MRSYKTSAVSRWTGSDIEACGRTPAVQTSAAEITRARLRTMIRSNTLDSRQRFIAEAWPRQSIGRGEPIEKMLGQCPNVVRPLAQRWDDEVNDVQTVEQVLAKSAV